MGLTDILKGKEVIIKLGHNKVAIFKIKSARENIHRYTNETVAFKNYTIEFTNGETEIYNSLNDIEFYKRSFFTKWF